MAGRKLKLTKEFIEQAVKLLEAGNYQKHVAQALGVAEETWYRWLREGEQGQHPLKREFYESVKRAEARAIARNVALVQRAAQEGNWQAAAWWLERKFPSEWGKKDRYNLDFGDKVVFEIIEVEGKAEDDGEKEN